MKHWIINLIVGILAVAIIVIISIIALNDLTPNETTLLGVLLTVLSIVGSWIVSSYFSKNTQKEAIEEVKTEHQNKLRTYALNAAEKVDNLSNELTKLANYLKTELEEDDDSDEFALYSKLERIESAIHIITTLKSVNDTSLSDWKGVIGDELEEREEEKEEREERLLELTEKIESILYNQNSKKISKSDPELIAIKKQLAHLSRTINPVPISKRKTSNKPPKESVENKCPNCDTEISYTQRKNENGHKTIKCSSCGKRMESRYSDEKGFYLTLEKLIEESINCPWCKTINEHEISNIPFTKEVIFCTKCGNRIKVTRKLNSELAVNTFGKSVTESIAASVRNPVEITSELLDKVESLLPAQPWPKGVHNIIVEKLEISTRTVHRCISKLIKQGRFNPQFDGIVYVKSDLKREDEKKK